MTECLNEGFIDSSCKCKCSEGITGDYCELVNTKQSKSFIITLNNFNLLIESFIPALIKTSLNPNLTCDFELDLCDWLQEEIRDSDDFSRQTGNFII